MMRLSILFCLAPLFLFIGCNDEPGELAPLFEEVLGLPGFDHPSSATLDAPPEDGWPRFEMGVRNIGGSAVTIASATLTEDGENFSDPEVDLFELEPDDQAIVRFIYVTPGGAGQSGTLIITSDAIVPELTIPISTSDFVAVVVTDGGPGLETDAGPGPMPVDAGAQVDAGADGG